MYQYNKIQSYLAEELHKNKIEGDFMIKRKSGVDKNKAFEEACKKNGILLTPKNTNKRPVSYIDRNGRKRFLNLLIIQILQSVGILM